MLDSLAAKFLQSPSQVKEHVIAGMHSFGEACRNEAPSHVTVAQCFQCRILTNQRRYLPGVVLPYPDAFKKRVPACTTQQTPSVGDAQHLDVQEELHRDFVDIRGAACC